MNEAPLLILLHGALMDRRAMLALVPYLDGRSALFCPDLAGHGQRAAQHLQLSGLSARELAADLLAQLPAPLLAAGLPVHLVGHSLGALVALELHELLQAAGRTAAGVVLGDPPLCLSLDTPSQHAAAAGMARDPVGQRLAQDCFFAFSPHHPAAGEQSPYLALLDRVSQQVPTHLLHGLLPEHRRADGSVDCGTFLSERSLGHVRRRCPGVQLQPVADGGHFVFHSPLGLRQLIHCLANS